MNTKERIKNFCDNYNIRLLIGTPAFGGMVHLSYMNSMLKLVSTFKDIGINFDIMNFGNESLITRGRNAIIARLLSDNFTHLLFIDADLDFKVEDVINLLLSKKELIGGIYTKKSINIKKFIKNLSSKKTKNYNDLLIKSSDYCFNPILDENNKIKYEKELILCKNIPTGFMMIQKTLIESMVLKYNDLKYINNLNGYSSICDAEMFYNFFDVKIIDDIYLSEDYYFCYLVSKMGVNIYCDPDISLGHTGSFCYRGNLSQSDIQNNLELDLDTELLKKTYLN